MAASDARPVPRKNVAYRLTFPIYDADGDLVSGAAGLDSEVSKDGAAFADCTNEATEIATSSGMYFLDLTADEMNADTVSVIVKTSTSGAKTTPVVLYPDEAGDVRADVVQVSGDATAADNLELQYDGTGLSGNTFPGTQANQTTILNRLGAWTGSARNTILGAFQALFRKDADASVPSDVNANLGSGAGASNNTTDSVEAIRDRGDEAWGGAGSSDWTADERTAMRTILGFDALGVVSNPTSGVLDGIKDKTDTIGSGVVTHVSPVATDLTVTIVRGDTYTAAIGRALDWSNEDGTWPDLTGATITFTARLGASSLSKVGSVVTPSGANQKVRVEFTAAETGALTPGALDYQVWDYDVQATLAAGAGVVTLVIGRMQVRQDQTT